MINKVKITLIEKDNTSLNELCDRVNELVDVLNDTIDQVNQINSDTSKAIKKLKNPQKKRRARPAK